MAIELKVPEIGESITEVEIGGWLKKSGEPVKKDEPLVTLESEKATVELPSPGVGTIGKVLKQKGDIAKVGEVIAYLEEGKAGEADKKTESKAPDAKPAEKPAPKTEAKPESKPEPQETSTPRPTQVRPTQEKPRSERLREEAAPSQPSKPAPQVAGREAGASRSPEPAAGTPGDRQERS